MSLRDKILSTPSRKHRDVRVAEWDTTVRVLELDTDQRVQFLGSIDVNDPRADLAPLLPHLPGLVLDAANGTQLFEAADLDTLKRDHPGVIIRLLMEAVDVSDLADVDGEIAEGNSEPTPS